MENEVYIEYLKNLRDYRSRVYNQLDELNKNTSWKDYNRFRDILVNRLALIESNEYRIMRKFGVMPSMLLESENFKIQSISKGNIIKCNKLK
jgi:hypothetical protein